jgi:hypothetical protein
LKHVINSPSLIASEEYADVSSNDGKEISSTTAKTIVGKKFAQIPENPKMILTKMGPT